MSTAYRLCPDPGDDLDELRELLAYLEHPDCDCPVLLDCPCGQLCRAGFQPTCPDCVAGPVHPDDLMTCQDHCPHCREECDCRPAYNPPCCHMIPPDPADVLAVQRWYHRLCPQGEAEDLDAMLAELQRRAWPEEYKEPTPPLPVYDAITREDRINVMARRARPNNKGETLAILHPLDRWRRRVSSLAVQGATLRNGARTEREVLRA